MFAEGASWGHMTLTSRIKIILTVAAGLFLLAAALMIIQGQQPTVSAPETDRDSAQSSASPRSKY